jgi:hypothetical protein
MNVDYVVQGLTLDVSVLEALLKRNRSSHGRALYYRRISMALKSAKRHGLLEFGPRLESFQKECSLHQQQQTRQNKKRQREERWGEVQEADETEILLRTDFSDFETAFIEDFPEILSRIQYASVVLFTEINRGFFLPFCTVAVGALARIRALIMQMGCWGLALLKEVQMEESLLFESRHNFESAIEQHYMEPNETKEDRKKSKEVQRTLTLSSVGIHVRSRRPKNVDSSTEATDGDVDPDGSLQSEPVVEMEDEQSTPVPPSAKREQSDDIGESVGISAQSLPLMTTRTSKHRAQIQSIRIWAWFKN